MLVNFMSANEISKNWCHYYLCQNFLHICLYSAKVQCVNNRSSFGRYSDCVMMWLWSIQCMHVIYTFICNCTIVTLLKNFIDISQKNIILNLYVHVHELVNVPDWFLIVIGYLALIWICKEWGNLLLITTKSTVVGNFHIGLYMQLTEEPHSS